MERRASTPGLICAVATAALSIALLAPSGAGAATTCSFNGMTGLLTVGGDPDVGTTIAVNPATGEIVVYHRTAAGVLPIDCGATDPTTTITDTITVSHKSPDEATSLEFTDFERLAPGATDEGGVVCPDEIEVETDLGGGADSITFSDGDGTDDEFVIGQDGVDRNPAGTLCDDLELEDSSIVQEYAVFSGSGADVISASGGGITGPVGLGVAAVTLNGGPGSDLVRGGPGGDALTGGLGKDKLLGMAGLDRLFAEDDQADVKIHCGEGPAVDEGAIFDRRKDPKPKSC